MAEPDDIDKLLREVEALNAAAGRPAQQRRPAEVAPTTSASPGRGRAAWAAVAAVLGLIVWGILGGLLWFLPFVGPAPTAVGAALGAALVGFLSGPPDWFRGKG